MRWLALLLGLLAAAPAMAQQKLLLFQQPLRPVLDLDFTRMSTLDSRVYFNRSSTELDWSCAAPTLLTTFAADTAAISVCDPTTGTNLGFGLWGTATNANRWARDLTNAYWVKTNTTAALTATGTDGVANSASHVSGTAANGTICTGSLGGTLQRITSAYVKRSVGVGEIDISGDNGGTWSPISINSNTYTRVPSGGLYQTAATPAICFRFVTNGDAADIDYVNSQSDQNATDIAPTTPILTQNTANIVRQPDLAWIDLTQVPGFNSGRFTVVLKYMLPTWIVTGGNTIAQRRGLAQIDDGIGANAVFLNAQTDAQPSNPNCTPASGNPTNCPDMNADMRVDGTVVSSGKVRCTNTPNGTVLQGLAPPIAGAFETIAYSFTNGVLDAMSCNNGAPAITLSNGYKFPGGNQPSVASVVSPSFTASLKRLVLGSTPNETMSVSGTITAADSITASATWENPPGSAQSASASYTVQGGDNAAAVMTGLANAITAAVGFSSASFSASVQNSLIYPAHPANVYPAWAISNNGGTETVSIAGTNTGPMNGYLLRVQVFSTGISPGGLPAALLNITPAPFSEKFLLYEGGGHPLYEIGSTIQCNRC